MAILNEKNSFKSNGLALENAFNFSLNDFYRTIIVTNKKFQDGAGKDSTKSNNIGKNLSELSYSKTVIFNLNKNTTV